MSAAPTHPPPAVLTQRRDRPRSAQHRPPGQVAHSVQDTSAQWVIRPTRSEEHTSEIQSLMRIPYDVFCLKKQNKHYINPLNNSTMRKELQKKKHNKTPKQSIKNQQQNKSTIPIQQ